MLKGLGSWHRNRVSDTAPAGIWFFAGRKEGLRFRRFRINFSLHPEACPGPQDSGELFERFFSYIWRVSGIKLRVQPEIAEL